MLQPEPLRRRILDEHTRLSGWLAELEHLAGRLRRGEPDLVTEVRRRLGALRTFFLGHLDLEDRLLAPALREAGGPGPERAERLLAEHSLQREALARFVAGLDDVGPADARELAQRIERFVTTLRADMQAEEAQDLDPAVLCAAARSARD